jgi:hypothetical protein
MNRQDSDEFMSNLLVLTSFFPLCYVIDVEDSELPDSKGE